MQFLVTGGTGYIGSHTVIELINDGHSVVILDSLVNSSFDSISRIEKITNSSFNIEFNSGKENFFYKGDISDKVLLGKIFQLHRIDAVIHFAGHKSVEHSSKLPLEYYSNSLSGTIILLEEMKKNNLKKIIFSSSATVYGCPDSMPLNETFETGKCANPYGRIKFFIEEILKDIYESDNNWKIGILRYFNPVGAHHSGLIGEDPNGTPANLMPLITRVALGKSEKLFVFGKDYDTIDGTGVRDYVHVVDVARGHLSLLGLMLNSERNMRPRIYNIGTGTGTSVLQLINTFERVNNLSIPFEYAERRSGDVDKSWASIDLIRSQLKWYPSFNIEDMCRDAWIWEKNNVLSN